MNRIEKLIKEKCPNGVTFKKVWELTTWDKKYNAVEKSMQPKIIKYNYLLANKLNEIIDETGDVLILETGTNYETKYTTEELAGNNLCDGEIIAIPWGGTPNVKYYKGKFVTGDNRIATSNDTNVLSNKFLYYLFENKMNIIADFYRGTGIKHPEMKKILMLEIPVPPIEIQEEIVQFLDKFNELEEKLEEELETEIDKRKSQYNFWYDKIFNLKNSKEVKLSDILISLKTGLNPRKFFKLNTEDAYGYYVTVKEIGERNVKYTETKDRVNQEGLNRINERSNLEINDVLFSGTGTIGKVSIVEEEPKIWNVKEGVYILKPDIRKVNPVFLMYLMRSNYIRNIYSNYIVGDPVSSVPMKDLKNIKFLLPSLEKQQEIVNLLDKFHKLTNNILDDLSAETELRRKQYEYYRNKLLSFEEMVVND